jgi:carbon monoxide dehydrogenase subunit G
MPTAANITVKKNDNTTDITWSVIQASGGENSPAVWRSNTIGTAPAQRPELRIQSKWNGDQTARRLDISATYPTLTTGSDGKVNVAARANLTASMVVPASMLDTDTNEACAQFVNLLASSLIKSSLQAGYAPT